MNKFCLFAVSILTLGLVAGCASSSSVEARAKAQQPIFNDFQKEAFKIIDAGGIAAVGVGESKSLDIALSKAKDRARVELAQTIETKVEALQKDFLEETGEADRANVLAQFSRTSQTITSRQLQGSVVKDLEYEAVGGVFTACALMELNPKLILDEISKNEELYTRFRASKAFEELDKEIKEYEAYKAGQLAPMQ